MQGVSKGRAVDKLIQALANNNGKAQDFLMCVGNDRSDEDMFECINGMASNDVSSTTVPEVFACSVGQKPSKAKYYVDDTSEVIRLLRDATRFSSSQRREDVNASRGRVTFRDALDYVD
jgi:trehalose 6-phosphate synthase/phosphatase